MTTDTTSTYIHTWTPRLEARRRVIERAALHGWPPRASACVGCREADAASRNRICEECGLIFSFEDYWGWLREGGEFS